MATVTVRISDEMYEQIKQAAGEDIRSVNGEMEWLLRTGLDSRTPEARRETAEGITGMHWDNLGSGGE